ncbi:hypothetical protein IB234_06475 [Pseudomonas sp. PDM16]|uniref:hypothetical protein n=1 Tax=Pseudomonas sp. PDM16 TaxID=2769292 RepID=UPI00177C9922|nr:hypothetical protein [Pseudomonas sp. PDM16]MBD9414203.1 hypothetical protein [Pseudomonas sp. PDM16]
MDSYPATVVPLRCRHAGPLELSTIALPAFEPMQEGKIKGLVLDKERYAKVSGGKYSRHFWCLLISVI